MRFSIFQDTETGARASNQDRMGYCFSRESLLMIVADGMGGHMRGEVAAQLCMQTAAAMFQREATPKLADPAEFLDEAFRAGHRELHRYREAHGLPECPRTTIVACVVQDDMAWWAHAGDSRLYLMRGGEVATRTRDHSKVENLLNLGLITQAESETHPERNKVLNCLGSPFEPSIEVHSRHPIRSGDVILLCSDGFWSGVDETGMAREFEEGSVMEVVPRLVRHAVQRNGMTADNTTALALKWDATADLDDIPTLSSLGLPDGAVTTTIAIGADPGAAPTASDLTEEEIERTIAEIQNAIQRSNREGR
ncbi:MAG: serine/threonine-protein phosphatase [Burkholderiaceae bacterium]|nr:serine/threonine-protein phosphatase [Burkholderiaceae bacterium]